MGEVSDPDNRRLEMPPTKPFTHDAGLNSTVLRKSASFLRSYANLAEHSGGNLRQLLDRMFAGHEDERS